MTPGDKLRLGMLIESARAISAGSIDEELLAFMREEDVTITFLALHSSLARLREAIELTQTCLEVGLHQLAPFWNDYPSGVFDEHGEGNNPHVWFDVTGREWGQDDIKRSSWLSRGARQDLYQPNVRFKDPETGKYMLGEGVPFLGSGNSFSQDPNNLHWDDKVDRRTLYVVDAQCTCGIYKSGWLAYRRRQEELSEKLAGQQDAIRTMLDGLVNRDVQ